MEKRSKDLTIIKKIETLCKRELTEYTSEELSDYGYTRNGYQIDDNRRVRGLRIERGASSGGLIHLIRELDFLEIVILRGLYIEKISSLKELKELTTLDLSNNNLSEVTFLKELKGLTSLYLSDNNLSEVTFLKEMEHLQYVVLDDNPIKAPPMEIVNRSIAAIRDYFKALDGKKEQLKEVKVLLVGDGSAGKTSLLKRLQGLEFKKDEPQTHGITIVSMPVPLKEKKTGETGVNHSGLGPADAKIHLWDFGGQEIMHATHQFFLSKRSLYILVTDSRKDERIEHWLKHIRGFGGDSPVLVVINKTDQSPAYDLNRRHLQAKYPTIKGYYKLSCATGSGIAPFKTALIHEISQVENMRSIWPKSWFDVKNALQNMNQNYITLPRYHTICRENNLENESQQKTLLKYLHDLGVILSFPEFELKEYQVLEPKWVTEAVYKIINSKTLADKKGYLDKQMLEHILNRETFDNPGTLEPPGTLETPGAFANREPFDKEEYRAGLKNTRYTTREQNYVVALMKAFRLCYEVGGGTLLVPDLLAVAEPAEVADIERRAALRFIYRFDYLPAGILPRFIVNMNRDIKAPRLQWRTGVVLENKLTAASALVKADKENKEIDISVNGKGKATNCINWIPAAIRKPLKPHWAALVISSRNWETKTRSIPNSSTAASKLWNTLKSWWIFMITSPAGSPACHASQRPCEIKKVKNKKVK
ncbi:MAG: GTP-binding protein, partial [bacterium]|nr:GTP-binding protein [bacterium]